MARLFLAILIFVPLLPVEAGVARFSILQGYTTETKTEFSIVLPGVRDYQILAIGQGTGLEFYPSRDESVRAPNTTSAIRKILFEDLSIEESYWLVIRDAEKTVLDFREFRTLDLRKQGARFALASCMFDGLHRATIWQSLIQTRPDVIFFLGDNVYADRVNGIFKRTADPAQLWRRYLETRDRLWIFKSPQLIPIIATWDDHDFGSNNADASYAFANESRKIFEIFFAQSLMNRGPGVASSFEAFGQKFILMDGRSFRSKDDDSHWGREQEVWLENEVLQTNAATTWLMQGDQFFGEYHGGDSYFGQRPKSFLRILDMLRRVPTKILFASGDRHYSEIQEIPEFYLGYPTWEITASSMHSLNLTRRESFYPNPRRRASTSAYNFVIVNISSDPREFHISSWNSGFRKNFESSLSTR